MSSVGAAPRAAVSVSSARAEASRKNGARSRGPKTAEGKARSARNALKHGLRAQKHVVLPDEDGGEFAALQAMTIAELAPAGAFQAELVQRIAVATWRLKRADRIEAELLGQQRGRDGDLGLAVIRDANGAGGLPTLLRYRGGALAELTRLLRALKALQADARAQAGAGAEARAPAPAPVRPAAIRAAAAPCPGRAAARATLPDEPERRGDPGECGAADRAHPGGAPRGRDPGAAGLSPLPLPAAGPALHEQPIEPGLMEIWHEVGRPANGRGGRAGSEATLDRAP